MATTTMSWEDLINAVDIDVVDSAPDVQVVEAAEVAASDARHGHWSNVCGTANSSVRYLRVHRARHDTRPEADVQW